MKKKRQECYAGIFMKINHIDERINDIKQQLATLKEGFINLEDGNKVYLNEIEAEKALLETMNEVGSEVFFDSKPEGDA